MIVAISGLIGVGKSTLCDHLSTAYGYGVIPEPVSTNAFLAKFYGDPSRWSFHHEVAVLVGRAEGYAEMAHVSAEGRVVIADRCLEEDRIFADLLHDGGLMSDAEYSLYLQVYGAIVGAIEPPSLVVYLKAPPEIAMARIATRGRPAEEAITLDYLTRLSEAYDVWVGQAAERTDVRVFDWTVGCDVGRVGQALVSALGC